MFLVWSRGRRREEFGLATNRAIYSVQFIPMTLGPAKIHLHAKSDKRAGMGRRQMGRGMYMSFNSTDHKMVDVKKSALRSYLERLVFILGRGTDVHTYIHTYVSLFFFFLFQMQTNLAGALTG